MNHRFAFALFLALILAAGLVRPSGGSWVFAWQEKPAAGEGDKSKSTGGVKKSDPGESSAQTPPAQDPKPAPAPPAQDPKPTPAPAAQDPKPTPAPAAEEPRNQNWGPYEIQSSIEFGFRGIGIHGNGNKFRSDHNYDPGFRIFDASMLMRANNGTAGVLFDELMVNTFGWGTDPNRYLRMSATKTSLYKFDANYRRIDYFNSLTNFAAPQGISNSQHTANTEYRQGDFDLTLWPAYQKFRLNLGYSLDLNSGPSVTTSRYSSDEFPVLAPVRVAAHDYRIGFDSKLWVFDLSFLQGWRFYKEDTTYFIDQQQPGNNTTNTTVIDTYQRNVPTRGKVPYTRFSLHTFLWNRLDFTGRYIYASGTTDYNYFDNLTGTNSSNVRVTSDAITILGNAKRPNALGDLSATVLVTPWLRISDSFRVQTFRINGGDTFNQVARLATSTTVTNKLDFTTTNYRRFANTIEGDVDLNKRLSFHVGFRYTDRHIEQEQRQITVGQPPPVSEPEEFDNSSRAIILGFKAKPVKMWTLYFDMESGTNDNVFTRTGNYDYTNFRARSIFRPASNWSINASVVTRNNTNPTVIEDVAFGADIKSRIFSGSADWTANERLNLSGGYTYFHVTTDTIVQFNTAGGVVNVIPAQYYMRDHFAFITAYWQPHRRVNFYGAYRIHNDQGQGDRLTTPLVFINSYPYQLSSPEAKVSVKLYRNVDWIAGYQYIDYKEKFFNNQFYQAHLPYTSLRLYVGRAE